jgi:hypothetical protein
MLLATAREMNAASFAHSLTSSINSARPGKGRDQGRDEGSERSRTSASSHLPNLVPVSNRELSLLERGLSYCKQRQATLSNRELSTNQYCCNYCAPNSLHKSLNRSPIRISHSSPATSHLPGSASRVENDVTRSKQIAEKFLLPTITFATVFAAPNGASPEKSSSLSNLNRQIHEFRNAVTYRKQTAAHCSNSQKNQKWMYAFSPFFPPTRISPRTNAPTENEL